MLWQPSGVEFLKETVTPKNSSTHTLSIEGEGKNSKSSLFVGDDVKARRKKKTAARTLSSSPSLLSVPTVRPDTPPPNTRYESVIDCLCTKLLIYNLFLIFCQ